MQIQNLRVYERGASSSPTGRPAAPASTATTTSTRLHRIRELLADGLNLAGIARVLALEDEVARLQVRTRPAAAGDSRLRNEPGGRARSVGP